MVVEGIDSMVEGGKKKKRIKDIQVDLFLKLTICYLLKMQFLNSKQILCWQKLGRRNFWAKNIGSDAVILNMYGRGGGLAAMMQVLGSILIATYSFSLATQRLTCALWAS